MVSMWCGHGYQIDDIIVAIVTHFQENSVPKSDFRDVD